MDTALHMEDQDDSAAPTWLTQEPFDSQAQPSDSHGEPGSLQDDGESRQGGLAAEEYTSGQYARQVRSNKL